MSFHAVVGENHGVERERTDQTLRSPLHTFLAIFYILSGAHKNSNFVPRMPFFSFEDNFSTRGLCPRVETVSEKENQGVQGTNITFSTKENSY